MLIYDEKHNTIWVISQGENDFRWSNLLYFNSMIVWINSREFKENGNFHRKILKIRVKQKLVPYNSIHVLKHR